MEGFGHINILWKCDQAFRASVSMIGKPIDWERLNATEA